MVGVIVAAVYFVVVVVVVRDVLVACNHRIDGW